MSESIVPIAPGENPPLPEPAPSARPDTAMIELARAQGETARLQSELGDARASAEHYQGLYAEAVRSVSRMTDATKAIEDERNRLKVHAGFLLGERSRCVSLIARMAEALGLRAGLLGDAGGGSGDPGWRYLVVVDLPSGQAAWSVHESELPLFSFLPRYTGSLEGAAPEKVYERVVNPGPLPPASRPRVEAPVEASVPADAAATPESPAPRPSPAPAARETAARPAEDWPDDVEGLEVDPNPPRRSRP
jgi:hypothetical protein